MMLFAAFICIIGALFGGWMLNEIRHERRRIQRWSRLRQQAQHTRGVVRILWG